MNKTVELLAPAGSYEAFLAAVENGANAVYMGGKLFNARANASNFEIDELKKIVNYAHLRDVKIHITLNTLLNDKELPEAVAFAKELYEIGVDALIIQDLGLAKAIHSYIPEFALHASTQISTHTLEGVNMLKSLGFTRVVLARELSISEIDYICTHTDVEIEIFSHGAQCICYSGMCLMSSMIGDRSGNRGKCAQPCRLPYKLIKDNLQVGDGYLLSPKDLSTLSILKDLPNVSCLKIEGRMKSPSYVATVVSLYRKYIDGLDSNLKVSNDDSTKLAQAFNRGGFSTAYLYDKTGKDVMCYEKPKNWGIYIGKVISIDKKGYIELDCIKDLVVGDGIEVWNGKKQDSPSAIISQIVGNKIYKVTGDIQIGDKVYRTSSKLLNQEALASFSRGFKRHKKVNIRLIIKENEPITVFIDDYEYTSNISAMPAINQPISYDTIIEQFSKTGNTPFEIDDLNIELGDKLFLPKSQINELRREALQAYEEYLTSKNNNHLKVSSNINCKELIKNNSKVDVSKKDVSLYLNFLKESFVNLKGVDKFYFNFKDAINNIELIKRFNGKKYIVLPIVSKANYDKLIKDKIIELANQVDGFVISNIGQLFFIRNLKEKYNLEIISNYSLNAFNSYSISLLYNLGVDTICTSVELTQKQINKLTIPNGAKIEALAYGNVCVMISEYCPIGSIVGNFSKDNKCSKPCLNNNKYYLRDRMNIDFRVIPDNIDCQSKIFNGKINSIETKQLNVNSIRIDIIDESLADVQEIIRIHKSGEKLSGEKYTNGHFARPV